MEHLKEKYRQFKAWQEQPHTVAPLSADKHECATCGTQFHGNYCPRCGQPATIGRYSFKSAFLLFLDVWGLGNRGMFRSIRDLILRPGYMIRDFLGGMQMAYFPPFKMFFLLIALNVLVDSGFNIKMENTINNTKADVVKELETSKQANDATPQIEFGDTQKKDTINIIGKKHVIEKAKNKDNSLIVDGKQLDFTFFNIIQRFTSWILDNHTILQLIWLLILSAPLYLLFRHNKKIPDIRYSEFFVSMVYITNMMTIYAIVGGFFLPGQAITAFIATFATLIPLKQLYGYSYKRTFLKVAAAFILLIIATIIISILIALLVALSFNL